LIPHEEQSEKGKRWAGLAASKKKAKSPVGWSSAILNLIFFATIFSVGGLFAQDLSPRAYVVVPVNTNAVVLTYTYLSGSLEFDGAVPITGATSSLHTPYFSGYHTLNFLGRTASLTILVPYSIGGFSGIVSEAPKYAYRSGLRDSYLRFAVNLKGGPAMTPEEFRKWRQKVLLGASFKIVMPTGQYDPTRLINLGNNRWAFKPEFGYSQRWGHWLLDGYAAAWFFTTNQEFFSHNSYFPGVQSQSESPVAAFEGHLSYDVKPRLWVSLDGNFWFGGTTSLNGVENPLTVQRSSRVGVTASIPLTWHQSLKMSFSNGVYTRYGGSYKNVAIGWQYGWVGWSPFSHP